VPIHFRCPNCAKLLALGTRRSGTQIRCPMCDSLITVPPRTQVQMPTTTVVLPDVPQDWWMDAPPVLPPPTEPITQPPALPTPAADAWWLNADAPPIPAENAISSKPPSTPPPLPETRASFQSSANNPIASIPHFPRWLRFLLAAAVIVAVIGTFFLIFWR
jgi:phage FluMu protein Com